MEDLDDEDLRAEKASQLNIPEYAKFDTSIGDEYSPCCKTIESIGVVIAVSDVGKRTTESICKALRKEGFNADWHAVKNTVTVKTLETGDRLEQLRRSWRRLVREHASRNLKVR
jgi:hypothetical protein